MKIGIYRYKQGWLRLAWSYGGKRHFLALGVRDDEGGRLFAEMLANQIKLDIMRGDFDPTLNRYRPEEKRPENLLLSEAWDKFIEFKSARIYEQSLDYYRMLRRQQISFFGDRKTVSGVSAADARRFLDSFQHLSPASLRPRLAIVSGLWSWCIDRGYAAENPWAGLSAEIKRGAGRSPEPFTEDEVAAIVAWFGGSKRYQHLTPFVRFCFATGCRLGEAVALNWGDLSNDLTTVCIRANWARGERKETKTGKVRSFRLPPSITAMLGGMERRHEAVFLTSQGCRIRLNNFMRRPWVDCLADLGIRYRKPYYMRSTFVSHALRRGITPQVVSEITGHSLAVMFQHYAGAIGGAEVPELW